MKILFTLYKYFPYSGLAKKCVLLAEAFAKRGHEVHLMTLSWQGDYPKDLSVHTVNTKAWTNVGKYRQFVRAVAQFKESRGIDAVIGFNKMAGLDVHYSCDPCYRARVARKQKSAYRRLLPRFRYFSTAETAVFGDSDTHILYMSLPAKKEYEAHYHTPQTRWHFLPPGISSEYVRPKDWNASSIQAVRAAQGIPVDANWLLLVGSGFQVKGVDRVICALASLPKTLRQHTFFSIVGQDHAKPFQALATQLGVSEHVRFLGGLKDIRPLLWSADVLMHPAYSENAGLILVESLAAGLPVVVSGVAGYANYIKDAAAGCVLPEPFSQEILNQTLAEILTNKTLLQQWRQEARVYTDAHPEMFAEPEQGIVDWVAEQYCA